MKRLMNKKLLSTVARRMAVLLLLLCLSATTTWAVRFVYVSEPDPSIKGGKAYRPDINNFPTHFYVVPKRGFKVKSVVFVDKDGYQETLQMKKVNKSTREELYYLSNTKSSTVTVTFLQVSNNVEVNFDMNPSDVQGPAKQNLQIGGYVTKPEDPTDVNFKFLGWYTDDKFKKPFDFYAALNFGLPYEDADDKLVLNLYAKWESRWSWEYEKQYTDLHIIGPGPMDDYKSKKAPWYRKWKTINKINIDPDVTRIGSYAFTELKKVNTDITIPASVKTIGNSAFYSFSISSSVVNISTPTGSLLDSIEQNAFKNANAHIDLSNSTLLTKINRNVFYGVSGVVTLPVSVDTIAPKAFSGFDGHHVYIPVPEGNALIVNGKDFSGEKTDGKADIISYLYKKYPKRGISLAVKLKMISLSDYDDVTVTFNANGHGTAPASVNTTIGQTITQPAALTAEGYTFLGWYKDEAFTEAFDFGAELSRTGLTFNGVEKRFKLNLYAKWQKNSCTVTFNGNGATSGTMTAVTQDGGTSYTIPACVFTNADHTFLGWATSADGSVEYQPDNVINSLLNDLTLYAVWENNESGSCGAELTWTLTNSTANGDLDKLIISGSGAMTDYKKKKAPWYSRQATIKTLIMGEGVTRIGNHAFNGLANVTSDITIPASVESIGQNAFSSISTSQNNAGISIATATGSQLTSIEGDAFNSANAYIDLSNSLLLATIAKYAIRKAQKEVTLPSSIVSVAKNAFSRFNGDNVYIPVLEKKVLIVKGNLYDAAKLNEDRLADIVGCFYNDLGKRSTSNEASLAQVLDPNATFTVTTDGHSDAYYEEEADTEDAPSVIVKLTKDTGVHPGTIIWLSWGGENLEEGTYVSGFTVTKAGGGTVEAKPSEDSEDFFFVMPEENVTVTTHTAPRETFTLDLTSVTEEDDPIVIDDQVYILMQTLMGYLHAEKDIETGRFKQCYDVNFDGKYDFELTSPAGEDDEVDPDDDYAYDYTVRPLPGASEVTTNYLFTPNYPFPYKYNKILVKFNNGETVENQIKFDDLYDSSDLNFELVCNWSNTTRNLIIGNRTLYRDGCWNTICLPFDLTLAGSSFDFGEDEDSQEKNLEARQLTAASITDKALDLTFSSPVTMLQAGVPYIIKWAVAPQNIEDPMFLNATIANVAAYAGKTDSAKVANFLTDKGYDNGATGEDRVRFTGTFGWTRFDQANTSILLIGANNKLYYPKSKYDKETGVMSTPELNAFRAYFKIGEDGAASAREITDFNIHFEDESTGIVSVHSSQSIVHSEADAWYTLDGRKLQGKPTKKGMYIVNGRKVVIK